MTTNALRTTRPTARKTLHDRLWRDSKIAGPLLSVAILLVVWSLLSMANPIFIPGPIATFQGGMEVASNGQLFPYAAITLLRVMAGWLVGSALGISVGWLIGESDLFRRIVDPYVNSFRFIPPIIWVTVFLIWFGYNEMTRVLLVAYATFMICVIHGTVGIVSIPVEKLRAGLNLGVKGWELFRRVKIPASLPHVFTGMRVAMTSSFMTIIAVEMLTASDGIGYLAWTSRLYFRLDYVFVSIAILGSMGWLADYAFRRLARRFFSRYGVGFD